MEPNGGTQSYCTPSVSWPFYGRHSIKREARPIPDTIRPLANPKTAPKLSVRFRCTLFQHSPDRDLCLIAARTALASSIVMCSEW
eukprot:6482891-Amphidinium_carterae.1